MFAFVVVMGRRKGYIAPQMMVADKQENGKRKRDWDATIYFVNIRERVREREDKALQGVAKQRRHLSPLTSRIN